MTRASLELLITLKDDAAAALCSLEQYIEDRLSEAMLSSPDFRREEARILYGTRAIKQPPSQHKETRREKRRRT